MPNSFHALATIRVGEQSFQIVRLDALGASGVDLARLPFSRDEADAIATLAGADRVFKATDFRASRITALSSTV